MAKPATRADVLLDINNRLVSRLERVDLFRGIAETLRRVLPVDRMSLLLLNASGDAFSVITLMGEPDSAVLQATGSELPVANSATGEILREGRAHIRKNLAVSPSRFPDERLLFEKGIRSYVSAPLRTSASPIGVLAVGSRTPNRYDEADAAFLERVADQIALSVDNMLAFERLDRLRRELSRENKDLRTRVKEAEAPGGIVGGSAPILHLMEQLALVAGTDATVLIQGESGTGKELVAKAIHDQSDRSQGPLVKVNCAAVPANLWESEFFGHTRGAFSGAVQARPGRFEVAGGGTLFLDEVGELPLELQGKLLRVLQDGSYQRVGENRVRTADVRIIAATNQDLATEVRAGRFREDLYYRLSVFPLRTPALRDRREDIPLLVYHFIREISQAWGRKEEVRPTVEGLLRLQAYHWPGNVRELRNVVARSLITCSGNRLDFQDPGDMEKAAPSAPVESAGDAPPQPPDGGHGPAPPDGGGERRTLPLGADVPLDSVPVLTDEEMEALTRRNIQAALARTGGRIWGSEGAAALLGIPPTTLASRVQRLGIERTR